MTSTSPPWIASYPDGVAVTMTVDDSDLVSAWRDRVARGPDSLALTYFDGRLTARELDEASDALAVAFAERGTGRGDRVGVYLQNVPGYAVALLALWKLGAAALLLNPMYRGRELRRLIDDARPVGMICADTDVSELSQSLAGSSLAWTVSTSVLDGQTANDLRVFSTTTRLPAAEDGDLWRLVEQYAGRRPAGLDLTGDDLALLTYTSGTTGPPKGAMNTHSNVLNVVRTYARWLSLEPGDRVLGIAPLFHITGAVVNATIALLEDCPLVLINRFHPEVALEAFEEHQISFTVGSITAFNAMFEVPWADRRHFAAARAVYSGGAPIPPATVDRFEQRFGVYIHNAYGMTETTSAVIAVPAGARAPVHEPTGTLSIGVPLPNVEIRVVDAAGRPVDPGVQGELQIGGPQVVPGYWEKPDETAQAIPGGGLRTGDGAIMDEAGWVYLVDRLKDQINVSGFKVWPREVEDALYEHPAIHEAAVVGQPDDYRGEVVAAYVSLKRDTTVDADELIAFVRERLAAYKAPRTVHIVDDLPKTPTGKIRRNVLRDDGDRPTAS